MLLLYSIAAGLLLGRLLGGRPGTSSTSASPGGRWPSPAWPSRSSLFAGPVAAARRSRGPGRSTWRPRSPSSRRSCATWRCPAWPSSPSAPSSTSSPCSPTAAAMPSDAGGLAGARTASRSCPSALLELGAHRPGHALPVPGRRLRLAPAAAARQRLLDRRRRHRRRRGRVPRGRDAPAARQEPHGPPRTAAFGRAGGSP